MLYQHPNSVKLLNFLKLFIIPTALWYDYSQFISLILKSRNDCSERFEIIFGTTLSIIIKNDLITEI